ncbi:hypothetical protein MSAN_02428400 [Mycena sanguinolenta]|uniref:DUF6533 domain-containing protein n=1 Tax=Mycena sanguinolenta TaxID=230812 RepID=A0A8H6X2H8_9AGAR|nr:hypothetical protein MSAN_02428400 [Mycena sanguinolenta]
MECKAPNIRISRREVFRKEFELLQLIADAQTTNYLAAAAITVLVFEHISTFSEEIKFVWKSGLSLWSVLYVWLSTFSLVGNVYLHSDIGQRGFCAWPAGLDTIWKIATLVVYLFEIIALLTTGTLTIIPLKEYINIGPILKGCYSLTVPRYFTFYAVPYLMPVITLFLRDGVFLFLTILLYSIVELTIWHNGRPTLAQVPVIPATALHAVTLLSILAEYTFE